LHRNRLIEAKLALDITFSAGFTMPAESKRISTMFPGTTRSRKKMMMEIPNRVTTISISRRVR